MQINEMHVEDIDLVLPLYIEYYNKYEDGCWTEETAKKRIRQVLTIEEFYGKAGFANAGNFVMKVKWFD